MIKRGRLIETFVIFPSLHLNWIETKNDIIYTLQFGIFYWYISYNFKKKKNE